MSDTDSDDGHYVSIAKETNLGREYNQSDSDRPYRGFERLKNYRLLKARNEYHLRWASSMAEDSDTNEAFAHYESDLRDLEFIMWLEENSTKEYFKNLKNHRIARSLRDARKWDDTTQLTEAATNANSRRVGALDMELEEFDSQPTPQPKKRKNMPFSLNASPELKRIQEITAKLDANNQTCPYWYSQSKNTREMDL